ncbi:MAG: hypothetical protein SGCHY_000115 [Lobulomycetales sp.]
MLSGTLSEDEYFKSNGYFLPDEMNTLGPVAESIQKLTLSEVQEDVPESNTRVQSILARYLSTGVTYYVELCRQLYDEGSKGDVNARRQLVALFSIGFGMGLHRHPVPSQENSTMEWIASVVSKPRIYYKRL